MYIPSAYYISSGSKDVVGGLATISNIKIHEDLDDSHPNKVFVSFVGFPATSHNYKHLLSKQEELKKEFGTQRAYPDPDVDTPWIEKGDIVNGEVWEGDDIW